VPSLREGDADEPLLARKMQQAAFIRISGRSDHCSNRESFSDLFPITLCYSLCSQAEWAFSGLCMHTFFLEVYRAICLGNTVYNIYKLQNGEKNSPEYYMNTTWIYF